MKIGKFFLLLCMASLTAPVPAESIDTRHLQALGEIDYLELESDGLGRAFHVFVDVPEGYAETTERYPVIYLLDGGNTFPLLAAHHHYLRFGEETPAAILVGISYGADTYTEGNMRQTDFTAPAKERDFWGGAGAFQSMLADELIPLVESRFRADPGRRILFGQSLGGQFVLYNALTRPDLFHGHIASNPALHRNLGFFLHWRGAGAMPAGSSRLFVSRGEHEAEVFREPVEAWQRHWRARDARPWVLETRVLPGQTHFSAGPEAFRQGLAWLLAEPAGPAGGH